MDAGVSDRDPVYFNGTKWVVATKGAVGFYDESKHALSRRISRMGLPG